MEEAIPFATSEYKLPGTETVYKNIKHDRIVPYIVRGMQELVDENKQLKSEIAGLRSAIAEIQSVL